MPDPKTKRVPGRTILGSTIACRQTERGVDQGVILPDGEIRWFPGFELYPFRDGRSVIMEKDDPHFGVIDREGNTIVPCIHAAITHFSEGRAFLSARATCLIDVDGTVVREFEHAPVGDDFHDGLAIVSLIEGEDKVDGFIDRNGDTVIPFIYSNPIIDPNVHDEDDRLSEGLIRVRHGERTGYINRSGAMVIEPVFEWGGRFSHGCAWVRRNGAVGFIDADADLMLPYRFQEAGTFGNGLAPVRLNDAWGYIDLTGDMVIKPMFRHARPFEDGEALVQTNDGWGIIDVAGNFVITPQYDGLSLFRDGIAWATRRGINGIIDRENRGVWGHRTALHSLE